MANYYNEIDAYAAEWLRNIMKEGLIPDGEVDTRSIVDVEPRDLAGFTQCHFFAGIAGWSHALRLAGWSEQQRSSFWSDAEWLTGADGKARRAQPGIRLLAHGVPNRVGRLRGYGNAIVPPLAAEVICALMEVLP